VYTNVNIQTVIQHSNREPEEYQRVIDGIEKPQPENLFNIQIINSNQYNQLSGYAKNYHTDQSMNQSTYSYTVPSVMNKSEVHHRNLLYFTL